VHDLSLPQSPLNTRAPFILSPVTLAACLIRSHDKKESGLHTSPFCAFNKGAACFRMTCGPWNHRCYPKGCSPLSLHDPGLGYLALESLLSKSTTYLAWIAVAESSYSFGVSESPSRVGHVSATSAATSDPGRSAPCAAEKAIYGSGKVSPQSDQCKTTKVSMADECK
jgi:hypothetical protein